jgi:hypothetical protein
MVAQAREVGVERLGVGRRPGRATASLAFEGHVGAQVDARRQVARGGRRERRQVTPALRATAISTA